ncbi:MAG: ribosome-associated translation inhibitor RaiA [Bacteroidales bacterium]|jgi:putative sigma-54 modulation protein|nr:ribosome-associated translation inhibitor RaiA [Bacteroidales bacterium]MCK9498240.1 ribosome-associated translation inhibitor RaiA [Bacteroidales bacterium]MDY0315247.1 ribosome-associated translation inhibitor RaiA [Bacteroidales bacterium]NLB85542.1 ribosome-associated translation inhibitor RaiA [Bacteroidales bacterium]
MEIKIQSVRFDADKKLIAYIENKVGKLSQVADKIIDAEVILRIENSDTKDNKVAEIKINVPYANDVFAKRQRNTFEESVDLATAALRRQLKKYREKLR